MIPNVGVKVLVDHGIVQILQGETLYTRCNAFHCCMSCNPNLEIQLVGGHVNSSNHVFNCICNGKVASTVECNGARGKLAV